MKHVVLEEGIQLKWVQSQCVPIGVLVADHLQFSLVKPLNNRETVFDLEVVDKLVVVEDPRKLVETVHLHLEACLQSPRQEFQQHSIPKGSESLKPRLLVKHLLQFDSLVCSKLVLVQQILILVHELVGKTTMMNHIRVLYLLSEVVVDIRKVLYQFDQVILGDCGNHFVELAFNVRQGDLCQFWTQIHF